MHTYSVGEPYNPGLQFPEGLHVMGLSAQRLEVVVAFRGLTDEEVLGFRQGPFDVGLASRQELVVLLARYAGSGGWMDAPFDLRLCPPGERGLPGPGAAGVVWILVSAETGIIRGLRYATLSGAFMTRLRGLLTSQLAQPFSRARYDRLVTEYQHAPPEALVRRAWVVEQLGVAEPSAPDPAVASAQDLLQARYPQLDPRAREVMAELLAQGVARIESRGGEDWWVDPEFGPDVPVAALGYDETLGMVDRRRHPRPGQA